MMDKRVVERLKALPHDELMQWRESVADDTASIRHQIETAKRNAKATGSYADQTWLEKAEYSLKSKQRLHQHILTELSIRKLREKKSKERIMLDMLRDLVGDEPFFDIEARAKDVIECQ